MGRRELGRILAFFRLRARFPRLWELVALEPIPHTQHIVRVCRKKHVHAGEVTPQAFEPREGESYVSFHWLEYIGPMRTFPEAFETLRAFLFQSPFQDIKPQAEGRLIALRAGALRVHIARLRFAGFFSRHCPRVAGAYALGHGRAISDPLFDPHAGLYTVPRESAELLAIQQLLLSKVVHTEVGKPAQNKKSP